MLRSYDRSTQEDVMRSVSYDLLSSSLNEFDYIEMDFPFKSKDFDVLMLVWFANIFLFCFEKFNLYLEPGHYRVQEGTQITK